MKKQSTAVKKDDLVFHRILILFLASFLLEIAFLVLNRLYLHVGTFMTAHAIVHIVQYIAIGIAALGIILAIALWKKKKVRYGVSVFIAGVLAFAACWFMEFFYPHGAKYLCYIVPIILVWGLIYYIYQREFLVSVVIGTVVLIDLWLIRRVVGNNNWTGVLWGITIVIAVLLIACAVSAWQLSKTYGRAKLFGKPCILLSKTTKYQPIYASCVIGLISVIAGLLLGATVAYFLMFFIGVYLLVLAVYYTTKLM